jgi:hypothetical protein
MTRTRRELELALSNVAYQFVMLQDALSRVQTMLHLVDLSKKAKSLVREIGTKGEDSCGTVLIGYMPATTTTNDPLIAFGIDPAPTRLTVIAAPPLTAFRAYVQSVLILASRLSDVFESTHNNSIHELLANDLMGRSSCASAPLPHQLWARIDGLLAHQTYFEDAEAEDWPIPEIRNWTSGTFYQFISHLRASDSDLCDKFEAALSRHRQEIIRYG